MANSTKRIVIVGGGIIGCTTAYYITRHPAFDEANVSVTIVEASSPAAGASGKAGGLVATWAYPKELVAISYAEHARLAKEHDGGARWGYRVVGCGQWDGRGERVSTAPNGELGGLHERALHTGTRKLPDGLDWIRDDLTTNWAPFSGETAQVHPRLFTESMLALAQERGATLVDGQVARVTVVDGRVDGVELTDGTHLPATHVVLAAGPWSPRVVPDLHLPIDATRAHSITLRPVAPVSAYCIFTDISFPGTSRAVAPEIYARPDGEVYACAGSDSVPLPDRAADVVVDEAQCNNIHSQVSAISPTLASAELLVRQACFLPSVSSGGGPIIGEVPALPGLLLGVGHTCWGICNGPGTGKALAELAMTGAISCANLSKLHPRRYL